MQRNKYTYILGAIISLLMIGFANPAQATHIMGGGITYTDIGNGFYAINLTLFRDCNGIGLSLSQSVTISSPTCGSQTVSLSNVGGAVAVTPLCPGETDVCDPGSGGTYGVESFSYRGTVQLTPGCGDDWTISWSSCCRNNAITTLTSNGNMYVYAQLNNTISNTSPQFNNDPTLFLCSNQENRYSSGAVDIENDSLVYSLMPCLEGQTITATNTIIDSVSYASPYNSANPLQTNYFTVDRTSGEVATFPTLNQVGVVCLKVEEFRNGVKIGEIMRDLQFTVTDCGGNALPRLSGFNGTAGVNGITGNYTIDACANQPLCLTIQGYDPEALAQIQNFTMSWNYGINGASFVVDYSQPNPVGTFCWTPTTADLGERSFFIEAKDDACPFLGSNIYAYKINVYPDVSVSAGMDTLVQPGDTIQLMANPSTLDVSYSWSPATGLSCTDCQNPVFVASSFSNVSATYTVNVVSENGCEDTDDITITTGVGVSTQNLPKQLANWKVFPNPATETSTLQYELTANSQVTIELYNALGERITIMEDTLQMAGTHQYALGSALNGKAKGVYLLSMTINGKRVTQRVLY